MAKTKSDKAPTAKKPTSAAEKSDVVEQVEPVRPEPVKSKPVIKPISVRPGIGGASEFNITLGKKRYPNIVKRDPRQQVVEKTVVDLTIDEHDRLEVVLEDGQRYGYIGPMGYELQPINAAGEGVE